MQELENFPRIIRELRQSYGLTQQQVAEKLEVTYQSYQAYERGIALPNLKNFLKLANTTTFRSTTSSGARSTEPRRRMGD